jgi:hypothetical protein
MHRHPWGWVNRSGGFSRGTARPQIRRFFSASQKLRCVPAKSIGCSRPNAGQVRTVCVLRTALHHRQEGAWKALPPFN